MQHPLRGDTAEQPERCSRIFGVVCLHTRQPFSRTRIFFKQSVSMKIDSHHSPRTHAKELFCFHRPKNGTRCSEKWVGPTRRVISDGRIGRAV